MSEQRDTSEPFGHIAVAAGVDAPDAEHGGSDIPRHMPIDWYDVMHEGSACCVDAGIADKANIVCRAGILMLENGTGSWRVRDLMNRIARVLGITCAADVGLISISCTCTDGTTSYTEVLSLPTTHVDTERIQMMEGFLRHFESAGMGMTVYQVHKLLDEVEDHPIHYRAWQVSLAAAAACAAFVFLLGGGIIEMLGAFVGAGIGAGLRRFMLSRRITQFACVGVSVAAACLGYLGTLMVLSAFIPDAITHEAGYIGAMLFIIPGFPLVTSGLDIVKMDLRSGLERGTYAVTVIAAATMIGWLVASMVHLHPDEFDPLAFSAPMLIALRLVAGFVGVYGFSVMFNSPPKMAAVAGIIGTLANTLRLECVDLVGMPPEAAAFLGAFAAGVLASAVVQFADYPRISLTVPSVLLMIPGLYLYRAMFYMGNFEAVDSIGWFMRAIIIIAFLPMGLAAARIATDRRWRYRD